MVRFYCWRHLGETKGRPVKSSKVWKVVGTWNQKPKWGDALGEREREKGRMTSPLGDRWDGQC